MSRTPAYTAAIHKSFLDALSVGMTCKEAAHFAGLAWPTWCEWKRRILAGDRFHSGIAKLVDEHEQAIARGTAANLATLRKHAENDSRAAIFLTQRRDDLPERRERLRKLKAERMLAELRLSQGGVEKHEVTVATSDARAALAAALADGAGTAVASGASASTVEPDRGSGEGAPR